ncbi:MAG: glycosyltransferase [Planctomycetes bacterium]|nr:glycosyltransferase [Planctomycetota bacterium]
MSIGVPVFNGERYLAHTLEVLLAQTFRDFEIIISDNASTDATPRICRDAMAKDPRVRYFRQESNVGAAMNYNRAFALARGRYFRWNAADDFVAPDALAKCVNFLRENQDFVLAYPRTKIIDDQDRALEEYDDGLDLRDASVARRIDVILQRTRECNAVFGLIDAERLRQTGLIGCFTGSDHILLFELALRGPFAELDGSWFYRRTHPAASSADKSLARQREFYDPKHEDRQFERSSIERTRRHFREAFRALGRVDLPFHWRMRCLWTVLRVAIASRRHLIAEFRRARSQRGEGAK